MFPFSNIDTLPPKAMLATCRAMLKVAQVDGMHPTELTLIRNFYQDGGDAAMPTFESLVQTPASDLGIAAQDLDSTAEKELLLALCVMTAYADGHMSTAEQALIEIIAAEIALAPAEVEKIVAQVKDFMLAQLSHLPDAASVARVAHELA